MKSRQVSYRTSSSGVLFVSVPQGERMRLVGMRALVGALGLSYGEQCFIVLSRPPDIALTLGSAELWSTCDTVCAGLGLSNITPTVVSMNVVTGINDYATQMTLATFPLPDIWWETSVSIAVAFTAIAPVAVTLHVEFQTLN